MGKKDCLTMNNLLYVICMCIQYTLVLKYYENFGKSKLASLIPNEVCLLILHWQYFTYCYKVTQIKTLFQKPFPYGQR